jgi:hypothetical protein
MSQFAPLNRTMKTKAFLATLFAIVCKTQAGWEPIPALPQPNGGFALGVLGRSIVVVGGCNWQEGRKNWLDVIWAFDPSTQKWEQRGKLPHPLAYAVASEWRGDLIIAGGTDGTSPQKDVWRLNRSLQPTRIAGLNKDRVLAVGGVLDDRLLILGGGADLATFSTFNKDGEQMHLKHPQVSGLRSPGDGALGLAASLSLGGRWFIFGGLTPAQTNDIANVSTAWAFDPAKALWRSLHPYPFAVRGAFAVSLDDHHILIGGGYGGPADDFTAAAFIYNTERDAYTSTTDLPTAGLVGLVRAGDFVYCLGGEDKPRHRTDACFRIARAALLKSAKSKP